MTYRKIESDDSIINYEILNDGEHLQLEQIDDIDTEPNVILMTRDVAIALAHSILKEME